MAPRVHWSDLKIGLAAAAVLFALVVSILLFARVGALHGETIKVYVTAPGATGVLKGTEVWVAGIQVGLVTDVRFRPVSSDTVERVLIEADVLKQYLPLIRGDSRADIRPAGTLIGAPVVYIREGTAGASALRARDTVRTRSSSRMAVVGHEIDTLANHLTALATASGNLLDKMSDPLTSVGRFRSHGMQQFRALSGVMSSYGERATGGNGSVGLAYRGDVPERLKRVLAVKDSLSFLMSSGNGSVGRFRRDSTLPRHVASVRAGLDSLRKLLTATSGVTRLKSDTTLSGEIARARSQIDSLMQEIKKHPRKYISF
jgi:phospholipid/cholesterol/gamma-HCH transport system substrate-binding protein